MQERSPLYGYVFLRVRELSLESAKQLFCYSLTDQNYYYIPILGRSPAEGTGKPQLAYMDSP